MTQHSEQSRDLSLVARNYLLPFILVTSLFFFWGGARSILDVLNKHYQSIMNVSKMQSSLIQMVVYLAYFLGALPAGMLIKRLGTRLGVVTGLLLFALGAFLFMPAVALANFYYILFPLFVLGCGLVLLETAANPYVTLLGSPHTSAGRLNIAQSFNGLGCMMGVLLSGQFFFGSGSESGGWEASIAVPYTVIAVIMLVVAVCFMMVKLPDVHLSPTPNRQQKSMKMGFPFVFGLLALVAYEISEISINTFFINFMTDDCFMSVVQASEALSLGALLLFMVGRAVGGLLMGRIGTECIFLTCAVGAVVMMLIAMNGVGLISKMALIVVYVFESIMFPTIFALAIRGLGDKTELASSILMMSVVGGAIGPFAMGYMGDHYSMNVALVVPLSTFVVVLAYAFYCHYHSYSPQS